MTAVKEQMNQSFESNGVRLLPEYVGCKVYRSEVSIILTQTLLLQSIVDELGCLKGMNNLPAESGKVLMQFEPELGLCSKYQPNTKVVLENCYIECEGLGQSLIKMSGCSQDL